MGLTLAELFLILLFLFLLLLAIFASELRSDGLDDQNEPVEWRILVIELRNEIHELKQQLAERQERIDELLPLAVVAREIRGVSGRTLDEVADVVGMMGDDWDEIATMVRADKEMLRLKAMVEELRRREKQLQVEIAEMDAAAELGRRMLDGGNTSGISPDEIIAMTAKMKRLRGQLAKLKTDNASMATELDATIAERESLRAELETLKTDNPPMAARLGGSRSEKGIDPACWEEEPSGDSDRNRRLFVHLFDVAVLEEHIMVRNRNVPEQFVDEKSSLPLENIRFMQEMDDEEFLSVMKPIEELGKSRKIRDYYCVFYVHVYDETSAASKERWQEALTVIGERFYTTPRYGEPWSP